ncbi:hypothetical protein BVV20_22190 [Xanthomonas oryzae pv. oryzae]|nr:hypothetical protein BVV20_22190 [Xanthomonas oryzae pv. oryzae]
MESWLDSISKCNTLSAVRARFPAAGNTRTETAPCSTLRTGSRRTMRRDAGRLATANRRRAYFPWEGLNNPSNL